MKTIFKKNFFITGIFWLYCLSLEAVTLPSIFGNHMVLQQNSQVSIWGWGKPGEEVTVSGSWNQQEVKTKINSLGFWELKLSTPSYGGPYTLTVKGYHTIVLEDILIGEVWLCSGQSNMEWSARAGIHDAEQAVKEANQPKIRFFSVAHKTSDFPQLDLKGAWSVCSPETMIDFSAVGYFFARRIQENIDIPIGLINSSWGGTPAEAWTSPEVILQDEILNQAAQKLEEVPWGPVKPGKIYHTMIAPLIPFEIAGVIWYQGESNTSTAATYAKLFGGMIQSWRKAWGKDFPFYFVQIAPWKGYQGTSGAMLRDQQRLTLGTVPNTGMVVVSDIGDLEDIHPRNKKDVGIRLANWALYHTYGKKDLVFSGPLYQEMKLEGKKIRILFEYAEQGLVLRGKELTHFEIAGEDQKFVKAQAKIEGNTVVVASPDVKNPVAVRFAWSNTAEPNLFNKAGLPASCFRTDAWELK